MPRVKVVSDAADLVPLLRAFDSDTKRAVFQALTDDWVTESAIEEDYGEEGLETLGLLENAHLVETRWSPSGDGPEKAYRSFYTAFNLNVQAPAVEIGDLLHMAVMSSERFDALEEELVSLMDDGSVSTRLAREKLDLSAARLRGLVKRSPTLEVKGHQIVTRE